MNGHERERLKRVVAAYGAEPRRWPEADRAALAHLIEDASGEPWMREAGTVDSLLDGLPEPRMREDLASEIIMAARSTAQAEAGRVVEISARPGSLTRLTGLWGQAALLAASLAAGLWLGTSGSMDSLIYGDLQSFSELAVSDEVANGDAYPWWARIQLNEGFL